MTADSSQTFRVTGKIEAVNGLRGLAIITVVFHHLLMAYLVRPPQHTFVIPQDGPFAILIRTAWLGVEVFFVLSGFVLYLPYRNGVRAMTDWSDAKEFYRHRAARLLPLYAIVALIGIIFNTQWQIGSLKWYGELVGLATTLLTFSPHGFTPPSNTLLWSILVEIWFGILFPFVVMAISRWGILKILICTSVACYLFRIWGHAIPVARVGEFQPFTSGIFGKGYEFIFGMLVCDRYVARLNQVRNTAAWDVLGQALGIIGSVLGVLLIDQSHNIWIRQLGLTLFVAAFSLFLLCNLSGPLALMRPLEVRFLQVLGCMCYSIYVWHDMILGLLRPETGPTDVTWKILPLFIGLTLSLSALSYRFIEFGGTRDWRVLFLISKGRSMPAK